MKKRILALLLAAMMLVSLLASCGEKKPTADSSEEATSTEAPSTEAPTTAPEIPPVDPSGASIYTGKPDTSWYTGDKKEYILTTADQLAGLNVIRSSSAGETTFEGVTIKLDCDVIINEGTIDEVTARGSKNKEWIVPSHSKYQFRGTLDGQGHTVSGVYIEMANSGISGMLGSLGGNAVIKNLNVVNSCMMAAPVADKQILGCLSGRILGDDANVTISDVTLNFNFEEQGYAVNRVGGFIGDICAGQSLTMNNCEFIGNVNITGDYAGGLVGYVSSRNMDLSFTNCKVSGNVNANKYAGSFFGTYTANSITLKDCASSASVKADAHAGGIAGSCVADSFTTNGISCTGKVDAKAFAGDIMGFQTTITDPSGGARPEIPAGNTAIRVMSFNLRLNLPETSGSITNVKAHRIAAVTAEIKYYDPDILGVQEDRLNWHSSLILDGYDVIVGNDYKTDTTERTSIYYKKGLKLLDSGNVWLTASGTESGAALTVADLFEKGGKYEMSAEHLAMLGITKDSPDSILKNTTYTYTDQNGSSKPYSAGYVILDTRNAMYGVFDMNGQTVICINTHLQHRAQDAEYSNDALQRIRSLERVKEFSYMQELVGELKKKYPDAEIIMTGDWNDVPMTDIYNTIVSENGYTCANFTAEERFGPHCSWNDAFDGNVHGHNYPSKYEGTGTTYLDYVFVTDGISTLKFASGRGKATIKDENGKDLTIYTSDHLPIIADLCFKTDKTGSPIDPDYQDPADDPSKPSYFTGKMDTSWYDSKNPQKEYVLTTADQLAGLMQLRIDSKGSITFDGITIKLGRDMIFNEGTLPTGARYIWPTIHSAYLFKGTFDGQGHTVSGIYMPYTDSGVKGMFGGVGGNAVFKDLKLENFYYSAPPKDKGITGALIAKVSGGGNVTISNVTVDGYACENSKYSYYCVGGIVGWVESSSTLTMENCVFNGKLDFPTQGIQIGGMIGTVKDNCTLNLKNCINNGELIGKDMVGGLIGCIEPNGKVNIENSENKGTLTTTGANKNDVVGDDQRS